MKAKKKNDRYRTIAITVPPDVVAKKDKLVKQGVNISYCLTKALELIYEDEIGAFEKNTKS